MLKKSVLSHSIIIMAGAAFTLSLQSCFTGVEGTSKITLSKKDLIATAPTEEDKFLSDISQPFVKDWTPGKQFIVTDDKFKFILEGNANASVNAGDTIIFTGTTSRSGAGGGEGTTIMFTSEGNAFSYSIDKPLETVLSSVSASDIPMLIDLSTVDNIRNKLKGQTLWTRTALWLDDSLKYKKGKKFVPVRVTDVNAGNTFFPLSVKFHSDEIGDGLLLINFGTSGNESRNFGKLFSLTDLRNNYRHITDENWKAIQSEDLRIGMTKEEAKLSKGNPVDIDTGHNYSNSMEIWLYSDGTYLQFVDGILAGYK